LKSLTLKTAATLLIIFFCALGVYLAQAFLIPLVLAALGSVLLNPLVDFLHVRLKLPQGLDILVTLLGTVFIAASLMLLMSR
jgi:predicted PurR-regulated permease PerM